MTETPTNLSDPHDPDGARTEADEARTDDAIRALRARGHWPQPSDHAPPAEQHAQHEQHAPPSVHRPPTVPGMPSSPAARPRSARRSVGIGALGLVGGVLLAVIVQDLVATAFLRDGTFPLALGIVLGSLVPVFAVLGVVIAILVDIRTARRRSTGPDR